MMVRNCEDEVSSIQLAEHCYCDFCHTLDVVCVVVDTVAVGFCAGSFGSLELEMQGMVWSRGDCGERPKGVRVKYNQCFQPERRLDRLTLHSFDTNNRPRSLHTDHIKSLRSAHCIPFRSTPTLSHTEFHNCAVTKSWGWSY